MTEDGKSVTWKATFCRGSETQGTPTAWSFCRVTGALRLWAQGIVAYFEDRRGKRGP